MRDVIGDFHTDHLMGEMKELTEKLNKLGLKSPRPWGEFVRPSAFKKPKDKKDVEERIQSNLVLYRANYLLVLAGIMSWSVIISPFTMGILLLCAGAFAFLLGWRGQLEVLGHVLTSRDKMWAASGFSVFLLLISGAMIKLIWSFLFGVLVLTTHSAFRPRASRPPSRNSYNEEINHSSGKGREELDIESPPGQEEDSSSVGSYTRETEAHQRTSTRTKSRDGDL